ncbi:MAG: NAD(P)/FAD-dependent oxidoreductase [Bacteroidota bacterium]|jgi:glycine oxidase
MNAKKQYLVVGGGVGGLFLTHQLCEEGHHVTLIDRGTNKSSVIAAGLINPLVFRRMTKSWRADELIPFASNVYRLLESATGVSFFHSITIRRFFSSEQERNFWLEKQHLREFEHYMEPLSEEDLGFSSFELKNDFGSGRVKGAYWVNTSLFIESVWKHLAKRAEVITGEFEYAQLNAERTEYQHKKYDGIIFCTGHENSDNPLFSFLPVQTTKGEILTVVSEDLPSDFSINRKCFVLPTGDGHFRVGATYVWNTKDTQPTAEGREEILQKLKVLSPTVPSVVDHQAGIRPTSPDRRPIMGRHPEHHNIFLFNGLGTKGYMIAPLLACELTALICRKKELSPEVDLKRFLK